MRFLLAGVFFLLLSCLRAAGTNPVPTRPTVATVYVFLDPGCPISQNATVALRELYAVYSPQGVAFVGLFPGPEVALTDVAGFGRQYQIPFRLLRDEHQESTRRFQARITPEVVVARPDGTVLYQGRIDNSYARLGVRRTVTTSHELADALAAVVAGRAVTQPRTDAVGCFITTH
ncbi:redoxin domain-containing protein [Hymenobacter sp. BT175]|uniref:redoxin domain-containing protein n=1 Tax=Hymenobacter translucens TaxID=2886507 RepID=UPI001D0E6CA8|nr:redoxin domain-containing protein [Hymenobacter translucens]MCC2547947.1 redoxin domain-containing protein [Hymenobacter translucens]